MRDNDTADVVVLGAGPAGLAATLSLARAGADVVLLEAGPDVGGLCRTRWRRGHGLDLGGHIPFVRSDARLAWLRDLLGDDLRHVDRPVACVRDGRVVPGRYLDQRPDAIQADTGPDAGTTEGAAGALGGLFGAAFVDGVMRPYLEKIDGLPLERIIAERPLRLMREQGAPEGFWFPAGGIGRLMDAMADAARAEGARIEMGTPVAGIEVSGGRATGVRIGRDGAALATGGVVASLPPGVAAGLVEPALPATATPRLAMRAVVIVALEFARRRVGEEAWVQIDDPDVPFARAYEPVNWSTDLAPPGRTALGLECYCHPSDEDPTWSAGDDDLARRCAVALAERLGWIEDPDEARLIDVVRLPTAYPLPDASRVADLSASAEWLAGIERLELVRGADVLAAVDAGEAAAARVAPAVRPG